MSKFIVEGRGADGQWSWNNVGDSMLNCTFADEGAAHDAMGELVDTCGWDENDVRVRPLS